MVLVCVLLHAARVQGQTPASLPGHIEVAIAGEWSGALSFSSLDALETDRNGQPYRLFATESELRPTLGVGAKLGIVLTNRFQIETALSFSSPELVVSIASDVENAEDVSIAETIRQLHVQVGLVANLTASSRNIPFVTAGAGYLRELHEGQTLAVDGRSLFLGGGLKHVLKSDPDSSLKGAGVRVDGRVVLRREGVAFDDSWRLAPGLSAALFLRF